MSSRIAHHLDFVPYDVGEMIAIGRLMLQRAARVITPPDLLTGARPAQPAAAAAALRK
jgi:hypothetical protein